MSGPAGFPSPGPGPITIVHHHICQHQVEIEIWPPVAEAYFRDARYVDPINTQVRFQATVLNAENAAVSFQVRSLSGGAGLGTIDEAGLYKAPPKGLIPSGTTELIVATPAADPMRRAIAMLTLVGEGPAPSPEPRIELVPKLAHVYYMSNAADGQHNEYIGMAAKEQVYRARIRNAESDRVTWLFNGSTPTDATDAPSYIYRPATSGSDTVITVEVRLVEDPSVYDRGILHVVNYRWPGIIEEE
ncbi:MAG: hypothetical protein HUU21_11625 [Polyangiaceae bacterium]|nr:hypothetical protein [Polyangiaceae bacterium]NUQ74196.1 hypothetical protein [Polyangiaceae bacterium]